MASNKSVVVLAPNGRRQTVKVTANTTILQVLEEVCKKQGFEAEKYDITHHNKQLDTSCQIGFSGLPNNAQLELCEAVTIRCEEIVTLGLQLEDGKRVVGNYQPNTSLYDVLMELCPDQAEPESNPVVIYMRNDIYGLDKLKSTTLRSLGITKGRVMLRVIHRSPDELHEQANVSAPLPVKIPKPREESPPKSQRIETNSKESKEIAPRDLKPELKQQNLITDLIKKEKRKADTEVSKNVPENHNYTPKKEFLEEDFVFLGERNAMVFSLETAQSLPSEELPDDFFDLTIKDAKKLLRDLKKRRIELENAPLQTKAYTLLQESSKQLHQLNRYKQCIIRVYFPDRNVLQGSFKPTETVQDIANFVREYLQDTSMDFYLYTTPPKEVLDLNVRLIECGCLPSAIIYFGLSETIEEPSYLKKELLNNFTSCSVASNAATQIRMKSTKPKTENEIEEETKMPEESDVNVGASTSQGVKFTDYPDREEKKVEKLPKWFKPS